MTNTDTAEELDKAVESFSSDGGAWRRVEFWTKSDTNGVFNALNTLDGLANVSVFKDTAHSSDIKIQPPTSDNPQPLQDIPIIDPSSDSKRVELGTMNNGQLMKLRHRIEHELEERSQNDMMASLTNNPKESV